MANLFTLARTYLLKWRPFYAAFIQDCKIDLEWDKNPVDSSVKNGRVHLYINEKYLMEQNASPGELALVLEQEINALIDKHQIRSANHDLKRFGLASDITTSQLCSKKEFPQWAKRVTYEEALNSYGEKQIGKKEMPVELYYDNLPEDPEENGPSNAKTYMNDPPPPQMGDGDGDSDSEGEGEGEGESQGQGQQQGDQQFQQHAAWQESNTSEEQFDAVLKDVLNDVKNKHPGNIPGHLRELIEKILGPPVVPWEDVLKDFIASKVSTDTEPSWKRRNRMYAGAPYIMKGRTPTYESNIVIFVDTSGSVSSDDLKRFFVEMSVIVETTKSKCWVICIDHHFQSIEEFDAEPEFEFKGRGGTIFDPVIELLNGKTEVIPSHLQEAWEDVSKEQIDGAIYFTDGECYCHQESCNVDMLWVITSNGSIPSVPGKVIKMSMK